VRGKKLLSRALSFSKATFVVILHTRLTETLMAKRKRKLITPQRVLNKVEECRFFLRCMEQHEQEPEEFGYYVSAFLSALKTVEYLTPIAARQHQARVRKEIHQLKGARPDLNYLLNARDAEVHQEGVALVMTFNSPTQLQEPGFVFRSARFRGRFEGRFRSGFRLPKLKTIYEPVYRDRWWFRDFLAPVVGVCRNCLDALEGLVNRTL